MRAHLFVGVKGRPAVTKEQQHGGRMSRQTGEGERRHEAEQRVLRNKRTIETRRRCMWMQRQTFQYIGETGEKWNVTMYCAMEVKLFQVDVMSVT